MLPLNQSVFEFRKQFLKLVGGAFRVYDMQQQLLLFSEQKAFKLREDIRVYADENKSRQVMSIKTQQIIDISPKFDVVDTTSGETVGSVKRKGLRSMIQDEWEIYDAGGSLVGKIMEDSTAMALLRRFLSNLIPQKYHFEVGGQMVGTFQQNFNPFIYRAILDLSSDTTGRLDRRLAVACGILLLAIEGKQD